MARICKICGRGSAVANNRSKSNVATKRLQKVNLQKITIAAGGRALACSKCRKTLVRAKV